MHRKSKMSIRFFPHSYLRDRQWDTIAAWPDRDVPYKPQRSAGKQVHALQALTGRIHTSWLNHLPLVNCRPRPPAAKNDIIYIWGGMVASGPFITDLDNPYALTFYNLHAMQMYRHLIREWLAAPGCRRINCMSKACRQAVVELFGPRVARKATVRYPLMPLHVSDLPPAHPGCRFLFISTQFDIKGGPALLRAFAQVQRICPEASLDVITHLPEQHRPLIGIPNLRIHPANLTRDEIGRRFLSQCDALIHPTYVDSFGMVALEALSWGLALIATDVYALRELCWDGINGKLLDPPISIWEGVRPSRFHHLMDRADEILRDLDTRSFEHSLTKAMLELCTDPQRLHHMRYASLAIMRRHLMPRMCHHD